MLSKPLMVLWSAQNFWDWQEYQKFMRTWSLKLTCLLVRAMCENLRTSFCIYYFPQKFIYFKILLSSFISMTFISMNTCTEETYKKLTRNVKYARHQKKIIQEGITSHNQEVQYTHDIQSKKQFWIPVEAISFPWYEKKTIGHLTNANISFYDDIYKTGPVTWEKSFLEVARNVTSARSFAWDESCNVLIAKWISTLMERWSII